MTVSSVIEDVIERFYELFLKPQLAAVNLGKTGTYRAFAQSSASGQSERGLKLGAMRLFASRAADSLVLASPSTFAQCLCTNWNPTLLGKHPICTEKLL